MWAGGGGGGGGRKKFPKRFAFYSVKATCIKTTGIKLSIFQLRLQVQVQFIMAKEILLAMRGLDLPAFDPETSRIRDFELRS